MTEEGSEEGRSAERLVVFVDAVVAIAITLLVLPLAEVPRDGHGEPLHGLTGQLSLDLGPLIGFAVSFFVVGRFWWSHHRTFVPVRRWSPALVRLTFAWLFTVVLLPAATAFSFEYDPTTSPIPVLLYVGTLLLGSLTLTGLAVVVHRNRSVAPAAGGVASRNRVIGTAAASIAFAVALVVGVVIPAVNFWALWLFAVIGPFEYLVRRAYRRRDGTLGRLSDRDARLDPSSEAQSPATAGAAPTPRE